MGYQYRFQFHLLALILGRIEVVNDGKVAFYT
jgi:hypothetical protein